MKKTNISIEVELDENHIPEKLFWNAKDNGEEKNEVKATMISLWDEKARETLRIDLWTKDMQINHMKMFYHQILSSLADTYERATNEEDVAVWLRGIAVEFTYKAGLRE